MCIRHRSRDEGVVCVEQTGKPWWVPCCRLDCPKPLYFQHMPREKQAKRVQSIQGWGQGGLQIKPNGLPCQFCAAFCTVLHESICTFDDHIKIQDYRGLWVVQLQTSFSSSHFMPLNQNDLFMGSQTLGFLTESKTINLTFVETHKHFLQQSD